MPREQEEQEAYDDTTRLYHALMHQSSWLLDQFNRDKEPPTSGDMSYALDICEQLLLLDKELRNGAPLPPEWSIGRG